MKTGMHLAQVNIARMNGPLELRSRRERYGIAYYVVGGRSIEAVAPIVARLAGA